MSESEPKRVFGKIVRGVSVGAMAASLAFWQGEVLRAEDNRLSEDQINTLARYGKIRIFNGPNSEGYSVVGYGGFIWDDSNGTYKFCSISHITRFDGPMQGMFEDSGVGRDPATCHVTHPTELGRENAAGAPIMSTEGVQEGETMFITDREGGVGYFTVSEATENMAKLEALNPGSDGLPENGDSGTLVYKQNASGDILAVGAYSGRDILPNQEDPDHPLVFYNVALFSESES